MIHRRTIDGQRADAWGEAGVVEKTGPSRLDWPWIALSTSVLAVGAGVPGEPPRVLHRSVVPPGQVVADYTFHDRLGTVRDIEATIGDSENR
jgi:hypothetical protein